MNNITAANFEKETSKGLVLVDFWASWCMPCKMLAPVLDQLATELKEIKFAKLNVDDEQAISGKLSVMGIPTLILFRDGKEFARIVGFQPKEELKKALGEIIAKSKK